jgi:hypothetical protein
LLDDDEPLDTIRVNLGIQETRNVSSWTSWPANASVVVTLQATTAHSTPVHSTARLRAPCIA